MMPSEALRIGGVVLCGGESSRMGRSKAWLDFAGESLLVRVVRALAGAADPVAVVAAPGQALPPLAAGVVVTQDEFPKRGPLQGMAAGLAALASTVDAAFVTACDTPWLTPEFVRRMIVLVEDYDAAMPVIDGQSYPLSAVYRLSVLGAVNQLLVEERRSPRLLLERVRCRAVGREAFLDIDPELRALRDLNTPGDYERAPRGRF